MSEWSQIVHQHDESGDVSLITITHDDGKVEDLTKKEYCDKLGITQKQYNKDIVEPFKATIKESDDA